MTHFLGKARFEILLVTLYYFVLYRGERIVYTHTPHTATTTILLYRTHRVFPPSSPHLFIYQSEDIMSLLEAHTTSPE